MKVSLIITRISLAIALILAITMLPHHHHHGEPCWGLDLLTTEASAHHHHDTPDTAPCSENHCFLQAMKTFLLAERQQTACPFSYIAILPEYIALSNNFTYITPTLFATVRYVLSSRQDDNLSLRGPPMF